MRLALRQLSALLLLVSAPALAWNNHTLLTWAALDAMPELKDKQIKVERMEDFLAREDAALEALLAAEEHWARSNVPDYPARPDAIAWKAGGNAADSRARFMAALRVNPATPMPLFVQLPPGEKAGANELSYNAVTTLTGVGSTRDAFYRKLQPGEPVRIVDVIATATNEPDYGMDIGLWEDNNTTYGKRYGFGKQPFGNPALEFATQAPFHMGFYHESAITYKAAPFLKHTYPEYRVHLYQTLATHALKTGHPYWAWRFTGWAMHYVGDLTQPYHATVLPGVSLPSMLWTNSIALMGFPQAKNHAITLVSNRHLSVEHYQYYRVRDALTQRRMDDPLIRSLRNVDGDAAHLVYGDQATREVVAREAHTSAGRLDATLESSFPEKYTRDPGFELGAAAEEEDMYTIAKQSPAEAQAALEKVTSELLARFGTHSRAFVRRMLSTQNK